MAYTYASGKNAKAICDVCGLTYKLPELKELIVKNKKTGVLACDECWTPDQPQLQLGTFPVYDPQALRTPRPDVGLTVSRNIQWGWSPVGGASSFDDGLTPNDLKMGVVVGSVTIAVGA